MHRVRFRDPAGSLRTGTYDPSTDRVAFGGETYAIDDDAIDVLPPAEPTKIVCVGRNYADHAAELDNEVPDRPLLFLKPPNALAAHGSTVTVPAGKERVDWEAEIAVVIGEECRGVDAADAVLLEDRLAAIPELFAITRGTNRRIRENLGWAFVYNAIAIPLAVTGLLNPLFAALAMATSSVLVVSNSARTVRGVD